MYQGNFEDKNAHANIFINHLNASITFVRENNHDYMIRFNKIFADGRYNIDRIKNQWDMMLNGLLQQYPTVESRAIPKNQFIYRTT